MPRRTKPHRGRPTLLSRVSTGQLKAELDRRRSMVDDLRRQREALDAEIADLQALTGPAPAQPSSGKRGTGRGPGRPAGAKAASSGRGGNKQSLPMVLHSLLKGKTMSVSEMADAAKKSGYKSKSKNFRVIVSLALLSHRNLFKKVARGQYTAK